MYHRKLAHLAQILSVTADRIALLPGTLIQSGGVPFLDEIENLGLNETGHAAASARTKGGSLKFAASAEARWTGNLNGAVIRMATLAPGGRISVETVEEEIARLKAAWQANVSTEDDDVVDNLLGPERSAELDRFDRAQLACVLKVCREAPSLSEADRMLFGASRGRKKTINDADRLRKYLARFDLDWNKIKS